MTKPFDPTKPCRTREGGMAVTIFTTAARSERPIVGLIHWPDCDQPHTWTADGRTSDVDPRAPHDLVNIPQRRECWVGFLSDGCFSSLTREGFDEISGRIKSPLISGPHHVVIEDDA